MVWSLVRVHTGGNQSVSLTLTSLSLSLSLSQINKHILKWGFKKIKKKRFPQLTPLSVVYQSDRVCFAAVTNNPHISQQKLLFLSHSSKACYGLGQTPRAAFLNLLPAIQAASMFWYHHINTGFPNHCSRRRNYASIVMYWLINFSHISLSKASHTFLSPLEGYEKVWSSHEPRRREDMETRVSSTNG